MESEIETDINDVNECSHDDKPSAGMLGFLICYMRGIQKSL